MDGPPAWREALSFILGPLIAVIFVLFLDNFIIINARIPSASMENTIMTGDRLIGNRLAYKTGHIPQRGDVIIFPYPDDPNTLYIKRVIGLPGEMVTIRDGKVYINDSEEPLDDSFVPEEPIGDFGPYYIPGDDYFVMGDNRNNSWDSRFWENQFVQESTIVGKAIFRYYPFDQMGTVEDDVF
ncbi:MAG: signal peptidase I [Lachnospiraceae bacterium]|nr:signal peptidase I [Lachnospiraceae bacterium]